MSELEYIRCELRKAESEEYPDVALIEELMERKSQIELYEEVE